MWMVASVRWILGAEDRTRQFALANLISNIGLQIESLRVGAERLCRQGRRSSSILDVTDQAVDVDLVRRRLSWRPRLEGAVGYVTTSRTGLGTALVSPQEGHEGCSSVTPVPHLMHSNSNEGSARVTLVPRQPGHDFVFSGCEIG